MSAGTYVELHARSAFSFLRGASQPDDMARQAAALDLPAMALCDRDGVYGAVRFFSAAKETGVRAIVGAELTMEDGGVIPVLAQNRTGYQNLCRLITRAKLRGTKTHAPVYWTDLPEFAGGLVALTGDEEGPVRRALAADDRTGAAGAVDKLVKVFGKENVFIEMQRHLRRGEERELDALADLASALRLPLLATNGVCHALPSERALLDVFTCAREHTHLDAAGRLLSVNAERHLKPGAVMRQLFRDHPEAVSNTLRLAERIDFTLDNLGYEFPRYEGMNKEEMDAFLRAETYEGARLRYGDTFSEKHRRQIEHELELIARLGFSGYFLIVWDIGNYCRENNILMQGRGSAANSVVCYSLRITACDPIHHKLLFERFLSGERKAWPDIDLDLPSGDKREQVIQEVYHRYGKHGAAMTANVITYRGRSAMREIGKAMNFPEEMLKRFSSLFANGDFPHTLELQSQMMQAGIPASHPRLPAAAALYQAMRGLPRHLGQHSGGMIICQDALSSFMPLENASMPDRVVAQWDKDDCEDMGIIKVDLLGLGMLAVLEETITLCKARGGPEDIAKIPPDDKATYDTMCAADTVGVFQVESRAQMATLPRLQPRKFYELVIEVAIIRPGPIQGGMLQTLLARRSGKEEISYFGKKAGEVPAELCDVLARTQGVVLFQEQILKIAMILAGFSGGEADELRRALNFNRNDERMNKVCGKLRAAMEKKGHGAAFIDEVVKSVSSFAVYGFPESHAISFAILAYASVWLKVHYPAEYLCGLLNNQPMGFYSPASLVQDARLHKVKTLPVNVRESEWKCTLVSEHSVRLGLCYVSGLSEEEGGRIVAERKRRTFDSVPDFQLRCRLSKSSLRTLAKTGALNGLAEHRRDAQWQVELPLETGDLFACVPREDELPLQMMTPSERLHADYSGTGLTTGAHPMKLIRAQIPHVTAAKDLTGVRNNAVVTIAGQVICRQRPGTAHGFVFVSLEDETGIANAIVTPPIFEANRLVITQETFLQITGILQRHEGVIHVKAGRIRPLKAPVAAAPESHDFR
ncbi:MAG TPA: error-prone DNA polymerase [Verrucomicrobiales bacterium]|nr:error-prone DNA polymerase [Verrucomicrobiales bacterium]